MKIINPLHIWFIKIHYVYQISKILIHMCFVKNIQEHKCCSITSTVYYKIEPLKEWKSVHFWYSVWIAFKYHWGWNKTFRFFFKDIISNKNMQSREKKEKGRQMDTLT